MFGFGLAFYGPYQFYWYSLLDWVMPARTTANFLTKVGACCLHQLSSCTGHESRMHTNQSLA